MITIKAIELINVNKLLPVVCFNLEKSFIARRDKINTPIIKIEDDDFVIKVINKTINTHKYPNKILLCLIFNKYNTVRSTNAVPNLFLKPYIPCHAPSPSTSIIPIDGIKITVNKDKIKLIKIANLIRFKTLSNFKTHRK
ncbi:hypothetical protein [Priestia megaterium]|uniref:hypothetical protein n=1 Tax=Priestia megaterium TaxID=1404 RepID=UPI00352B251E